MNYFGFDNGFFDPSQFPGGGLDYRPYFNSGPYEAPIGGVPTTTVGGSGTVTSNPDPKGPNARGMEKDFLSQLFDLVSGNFGKPPQFNYTPNMTPSYAGNSYEQYFQNLPQMNAANSNFDLSSILGHAPQ